MGTITLDTIKKNISLILWFGTIIIGSGSFSVLGGIDKTRELFAAPERIKQLEDTIVYMANQIRQFRHYQEMDWELGRLMTDDVDTLLWYYANDDGYVYYIDIRHNAEMIELAFLHGLHMTYPVELSHADNRKKITVDNPVTGIEERHYLFIDH